MIYQSADRVEIAADSGFITIHFESGKSKEIDSLAYHYDIILNPRTRQYWRVTVWDDAGNGVTSEPAWFETAKMNEPWKGFFLESAAGTIGDKYALTPSAVFARINTSSASSIVYRTLLVCRSCEETLGPLSPKNLRFIWFFTPPIEIAAVSYSYRKLSYSHKNHVLQLCKKTLCYVIVPYDRTVNNTIT
ncbi:hypothetical protein QFZ31_002331 [Neobacillus niacini]|uniref:glycoside hydrolase family 78 protein n=1 Tax=Neobacillus driksii TaxID=3035913 RepID=UPI0027808AA9|nr:hypothetical protein [Neobacillus niacini]MDQ0972453.1 hypothetical protein [Neobacillus niacini]